MEVRRSGSQPSGPGRRSGSPAKCETTLCWTQCEGEPVVQIRPGDVIRRPPNHRHWQGSTSLTRSTWWARGRPERAGV